MPKHPESRREENENASTLDEHEQMIRALKEAAERLANARKALKKEGRASDSRDGTDPGREP